MKTIYFFLAAALSGASLIRLMPDEIKAERLLAQSGSGDNKPSQAQSGSQANTIGSQDRDPGKSEDSKEPASISQKGQSRVSHSEQAEEEGPPVFQVSSDPRDQVQFLVDDGIVTLQGSVGTRELARKLIKKYARLPGVREVHNRLTVRTNNDAKIAVQVREALSNDPDTRVGGIAVTVCDGIVFLSGTVSSAQESQRAEQLARGSQGVKGVNNGLRLPGQTRYPVQVTARSRISTRRK
jgi:osmotically-inducible protein OsmY